MANTQVYTIQAITLLHIDLVRHSNLAPLQPAQLFPLQSRSLPRHGTARFRQRALVDRIRVCARDAHAHLAHRASHSIQRRAHLHRKNIT